MPYPALASWVELHVEPTRSGEYTLLVNLRDGVALRLAAEESDLCRSLDGKHAPAGHEALLAELCRAGFLTDSPLPESDGRPLRDTFDVKWRGADRFVKRLHQAGAGGLLAARAVALQVVMALAGVLMLVRLMASGADWHWRVGVSDIALLLAVNLLAITVHEVAHALVVVHHGRSITAMGFRLHLGAPACYVDAMEALLLTRRQRLLQAAAGPWAEWLLTSCFILLALLTRDPLLTRFAMVNSLVVASNLLPFAGLDGSLLLSDILREPDLPGESRRALRDLLGRTASTRRELWLGGYAVANGLVSVALLVGAGAAWYALFGRGVSDLVAQGPAGQLLLVALGWLLLRPMRSKAAPRARSLVRGVGDRVRFRWQRGWRVEATKHLAEHPEISRLGELSLGVVAGGLTGHLLSRRRPQFVAPTDGLVALPRKRPYRVRAGQPVTTRSHKGRLVFLGNGVLDQAAALS